MKKLVSSFLALLLVIIGQRFIYKNFILEKNTRYQSYKTAPNKTFSRFINYIEYDNNQKLYRVMTVLNGLENQIYHYSVTDEGIIKFDFLENYFGLLMELDKTNILAEAMLSVSKSINEEFLYGRTVGGLNTELRSHFVMYKLNINTSRTRVVDMGATFGLGYDDNAVYFEGFAIEDSNIKQKIMIN